MSEHRIDRERLAALARREAERFTTTHPKSAELASQARPHLLSGVPMHWMSDWGTPFSLFVSSAAGNRLVDVDGHEYLDFCLGDTGAMFGHSPAPVAAAIAQHATGGYTTMLPSPDAARVGALLAERFGLPVWQVCTSATDANRFVIRWARALTDRDKILVFDGCYHGTADDTLVRLHGGDTVPRPGLVGQVNDLAAHTVVAEFNDLAGVEALLARGDVAAVLTEPALTNIGMVLPEPGFIEGLRALTERYDTLLILDETHTISAGWGGWSGELRVVPDLLTLGKPVAGGLPAAVFGMSRAVAERAEAFLAQKEAGHSGMGTTLSANLFTLAAMRANLESVMTPNAYATMQDTAAYLAERLTALFDQHRLPWCVTQIGARCEFQFCAERPRTGREAEAAMDHELEAALHLYLLNRGVLITPFHNMTLCAPDTRRSDVDRLVDALGEALVELAD
ncbi:aspartate aminotransferase family protein [Crenobacter sp. SG2303]|uniref:Aspartate aminotransferase family protein n=1 Tax=Crenobacter oryzisoli TaxID=3056844 RepID=A0ABT7XJC2_9NEIS|nr:aspartate aminotransferase family protein [Crenobacter sp. SG2303]MDN0073808.1 aspartate aminotransferase family protein [Crenobacter sp. SG2303]